MSITLEQIVRAGYEVPAAPLDDWRTYDERDPVPGYFQFDWLSSRHPDLYHRFALSSVGLMNELNKLVDLTGLQVVEVGAGTGRATIEAAKKAKSVTAIDAFESVVSFGRDRVRQAGLRNVNYARGNAARLPLPDNAFDACICSWALPSYPEAYRILKPDGYLFQLGPAPGSLCGELTAMLASAYPDLVTEIAPADQFESSCPAVDSAVQEVTWDGVPVTPPTRLHDFTYIAEYADEREAAAIIGRLYGPAARKYMSGRRQSTVSWRLRIGVGRVRK